MTESSSVGELSSVCAAPTAESPVIIIRLFVGLVILPTKPMVLRRTFLGDHLLQGFPVRFFNKGVGLEICVFGPTNITELVIRVQPPATFTAGALLRESACKTPIKPCLFSLGHTSHVFSGHFLSSPLRSNLFSKIHF